MRSPSYEMDSSKAYSISQSSADTLLVPEPQPPPRSAPASTRGCRCAVNVLVWGHLALFLFNLGLDSLLWNLYPFGDHGSAWGSRVELFRAADWPVIGANSTAFLDFKQRPTLQVGSLYMRGATHGYDAFPHASADVHNADPGTVFIIDGLKPTSKLGNVYKRDGKSLTISAGALREYLRAMVWVTSDETVKNELQKSIAHLSDSTFRFLGVGWILGGIVQMIGGIVIRRYYDTTTWPQSALEAFIRFGVVLIVILPGCPWLLAPVIVSVAQVSITLLWAPLRRLVALFWNGARGRWNRRRDRYSV